MAKRTTRRPTARWLRLGGAALLSLAPAAGCGREFFRQWADQDVTEAVFEKSRDPRWSIPMFTVDPPAMSRFAEPYDPDRPAAPPDDPAAEALAPVPQKPNIRLMTPVEGTGYLDQLEQGRRYQAPPDENVQREREATELPPLPGNAPPPGRLNGRAPLAHPPGPSTPRPSIGIRVTPRRMRSRRRPGNLRGFRGRCPRA